MLRRSNHKTTANIAEDAATCSQSIDLLTPETKTGTGGGRGLEHYAAADMRTSVDTLNIRKMRSTSPQTGAYETTLSENEHTTPLYEEKQNKRLRSFSFSSESDSGQQGVDGL